MDNREALVLQLNDEEELWAASKAVAELRAERAKAEKLAKADESINRAVNIAIASVGIANVKSIIQKINRDLRELDG